MQLLPYDTQATQLLAGLRIPVMRIPASVSPSVVRVDPEFRCRLAETGPVGVLHDDRAAALGEDGSAAFAGHHCFRRALVASSGAIHLPDALCVVGPADEGVSESGRVGF